MVKKYIGSEYQINVEGEWDNIATAIRSIDSAVWRTIPDTPEKSKENQKDILRALFAPYKDEKFNEYNKRILKALFDEKNFRRNGKYHFRLMRDHAALTTRIIHQKIIHEFDGSYSDGIFRVSMEITGKSLEALMVVGGASFFYNRGDKIKEYFEGALDEKNIEYNLKRTSRMV